LFLLVALCRKNPEMLPTLRHGVPRTAAIAMLLIISAWLVSCTGGATSSVPVSLSAGTPLGSSTITVTATEQGSVSLVQISNLTLIVQ
jgi:hypothetical protein